MIGFIKPFPVGYLFLALWLVINLPPQIGNFFYIFNVRGNKPKTYHFFTYRKGDSHCLPAMVELIWQY